MTTTTPTYDNPYPAGSDLAAHFDTLITRCSTGTYDRFCEQVAQANFCRAPIRLSGSISSVDATGKTTTTYSTATEPDGVILKACRNRRESACPSCASLYRSDARHIVRAGLAGGKGVPQSISSHPAVFATFTAPSFGTVHRGPKNGTPVPCHPGHPGHRCKHGKSEACFARHEDGDAAIGTPICPRCYDYTGAVLFNATANTLWRYTTTYLRRHLARIMGMKPSDFDASYRVSFAKVIEYQRRGVVHVHAVIRVDGIGENGEPVCPEAVSAAHLMVATMAAARQVGVPFPLRAKNRSFKARWGEQVDVAPLNGSTPEAVKKIAAYVAKYATKSLDTTGILDKRIKQCDARIAKLPDHPRRLVQAALTLAGNDACAKLKLHLWANAYGYRGHWLTKSRRYSTTFRALHEARIAWATARGQGSLPGNIHGPPTISESNNDRQATTLRRFSFMGRGYKCRGDAVFARSEGEKYVEYRRLAWEAKCEERALMAEIAA